jgi:hypothetical protein
MIYTAQYVIKSKYITRASGRGLGPINRDFFGPYEMTSSRTRVPFGVQKLHVRTILGTLA